MKNVTDFRKTLESGVDPHLVNAKTNTWFLAMRNRKPLDTSFSKALR